MDKPRARLENWFTYGDSLVGQILDHPRQADFKAPFQRTSALVRFEPENGIAETLNTIYTLGQELLK